MANMATSLITGTLTIRIAELHVQWAPNSLTGSSNAASSGKGRSMGAWTTIFVARQSRSHEYEEVCPRPLSDSRRGEDPHRRPVQLHKESL
jgi:hypothetical protein